MNWDSIKDMDPRNSGPLVFVAIGLALVIVVFLVGMVWIAVDQSNERARCSNLVPGADLSGCSPVIGRLVGKDLTDADLSGADVSDKDLFGANLTGADLTGADLTKANLTDADLTDAVLTDVLWDRTTCPDGQVTSAGEPC